MLKLICEQSPLQLDCALMIACGQFSRAAYGRGYYVRMDHLNTSTTVRRTDAAPGVSHLLVMHHRVVDLDFQPEDLR